MRSVYMCIVLHCHRTVAFGAISLFKWVVYRFEYALLCHLDRFDCFLQIFNTLKYIQKQYLARAYS